MQNGGQLVIFSSPTINGNLNVLNGGQVLVASNFTLNGTVNLNSTGDPTYWRILPGSGTQLGTGQMILGGTSSNNHIVLGFGGGASIVTISPGITIRGQGVVENVGASSLINQGTIRADVPGKTLSSSVSTLTNQGTLAASGGGMLSISNLAANAGTIAAGVGSLVTINGAAARARLGLCGSISGAPPQASSDMSIALASPRSAGL